MVTRRGQGWTVDAIAEEARVSARTVQRALNERDVLGQEILDREAVETIRRMAVQFEQAAANLEAIAADHVDSHPAVAVGAIGRAMDARRQVVALLQTTNRLPRDLGEVGNLVDLHEIAREMVTAVKGLKAGTHSVEQVEVTFKRVIGIGGTQPGQDEIASPRQVGLR
jgi:AcrR family transcriptional regulator